MWGGIVTQVLRKCKPEIKGGKEKKHRTEYWQVAEEVKKPRLISAGGGREKLIDQGVLFIR